LRFEGRKHREITKAQLISGSNAGTVSRSPTKAMPMRRIVPSVHCTPCPAFDPSPMKCRHKIPKMMPSNTGLTGDASPSVRIDVISLEPRRAASASVSATPGTTTNKPRAPVFPLKNRCALTLAKFAAHTLVHGLRHPGCESPTRTRARKSMNCQSIIIDRFFVHRTPRSAALRDLGVGPRAPDGRDQSVGTLRHRDVFWRFEIYGSVETEWGQAVLGLSN
jgi:hypothetical protein